jgi:hypothetical protein
MFRQIANSLGGVENLIVEPGPVVAARLEAFWASRTRARLVSGLPISGALTLLGLGPSTTSVVWDHLIYAYMMAITILVVLLVGMNRANAPTRVVRLAIIGRSHPNKDAELAANLDRLQAAAVQFRYFSADVTDPTAVTAAVREAELQLGPITALIHGAGTNVPKLITELDLAGFQRTLAPKIEGLKNILAAIDPQRLRLLVTFSSIIGRGGLRGEADYAAELRDRLREAVRLRLVSDVPLGVFLSGGIDSSSIVAMMAELMPPASIKTFSIGFDDRSFDESSHARRVAQFFGTDHREDVLRPETMVDILPEVAGFLDEPFADASIVPTYLLSRFTRQHVTVALGGDGGDELLAGYPTFQAERAARLYRVPRVLHERVLQPLAARLPVSHDNFSFDFKLKRFLQGVMHRPGVSIKSGSVPSTRSARRRSWAELRTTSTTTSPAPKPNARARIQSSG